MVLFVGQVISFLPDFAAWVGYKPSHVKSATNIHACTSAVASTPTVVAYCAENKIFQEFATATRIVQVAFRGNAINHVALLLHFWDK